MEDDQDDDMERIEWVCVEFSPNGTPGPEHRLWMSAEESGALLATGVDEMGAYSLRQATLNRALQWAHGPSLDDDQVRAESNLQRRLRPDERASRGSMENRKFAGPGGPNCPETLGPRGRLYTRVPRAKRGQTMRAKGMCPNSDLMLRGCG